MKLLTKKNPLLAFALLVTISFALISCKNKVSKEEVSGQSEEVLDGYPIMEEFIDMDDFHDLIEFNNLLFRSDGFYPGIVSEWIQVVVEPTNQKITSAFYWNTSDDRMQDLELLDYQYIDDEISGFSGRLKLFESEFGFGMYEDQFNLVHGNGRFQEFFLEVD